MHKLLARQLRAAAKKDGTGTDLDALSAIVDQAYAEFDRERRLNHRAATLMEEELRTAHAQAKREHDAVLGAILDNSSDGMLVLDESSEVILANAAAEKQFGAQAGGLFGLTIEKLLGASARRIADGEHSVENLPELAGVALDGRTFPVEFSHAELDMADGKRQLWMVRDISERVRAQREILESHMRFRDFAEASSDCFWEMDHSLSKVEVSSAAQSDLVARLPSLLMPRADGVPASVSEEGWRTLQQNLSARQRVRVRLEVERDNGETLYVSVSGKPVFSLEGNFSGYRGTARDITREIAAREAARRAERRLIEAMDAAPCAVALVDSQLQLVSGNSALRTLVSATGERLPFGRSFCGFVSESLNVQSISPEILRRLADSGEMLEIAIGPCWYLIAACGLSDGGMVLTLSDITVLKQRECELAEAKVAAESASRLKSQFLATMSHELRTPLNAILGFSEVIRDSVFGDTEDAADKYAEYAASIHSSGRHLLALISEILDLSKIEAGTYILDTRTLDLREMIEGTLTIVAPAAEKAGVELRPILPDAQIWFSGDERAVRQITINLLANAVKFTPRGGNVTVEVSATESTVEFSVTDTGIGIAKEHIPAVFELFRQVDSSIRRRHEGTGLGLAITKRLVELHGGTITLESEPAVGTQVRVRIPGRLHGAGFAPAKEAAA